MRSHRQQLCDLRGPGFRGGGSERNCAQFIAGTYSTGTLYAAPSRLQKAAQIDMGYPPPHGTGSYTLNGESRVYFGKGTYGGAAQAFEWTAKELVFAAWPMLICDGIVQYPLGGPYAPGTSLTFMIPAVVFVYPITQPWTLPTTSGVLTSEPNSLFHDNIAGGSSSGFVNPATGLIDNYSAQHTAGEMVFSSNIDYTSIVLDPPSTTLLSWKTTFRQYFLPHAGTRENTPWTRPGWAVSGIPVGPFSKSHHMLISNPPSGTCYGFGLYIFDLYDYYSLTTDTAGYFLLSRATNPFYINAVERCRWWVGLDPYYESATSNEEHPFHADDTGLSGSELQHCRWFGAYENPDERAIYLE